MVTGDLSCIAPILFANVNFMLVYMRKNYATLEINPYSEKLDPYARQIKPLSLLSYFKLVISEPHS